MKKTRFILSVLVVTLAVNLSGQNIEITFAGDNNGENISLDSLFIKNLSQNADIMLYAPDTSINLLIVGQNELPSNQNKVLRLSQNFPNPFINETQFDLLMEKDGLLELKIFNLLGEQLGEYQNNLDKGNHSFSFKPGNEKIYLLSASAFGFTNYLKLSCVSELHGNCAINYLGNNASSTKLKSIKSSKDFPFEFGDDLLFVAYHDLGESGMVDSPEESYMYTFQFATNIPCIGVPTVDYDGQTYNTIQIFSQCWFKENLNVGTRINSSQAQLDNNIIEKYCLSDIPAECEDYGGVYMWEELMQYTTEEGTQGICPPGWHVPSDVEWKVLEGAVDSQYEIGNSVWNLTIERGFDAGKNLKSTTGWYGGGNGFDAFGFNAISGGYYYSGIGWAGGSLFGPFYTSSHKVVGTAIKPYDRGFSWMWDKISRGFDLKEHAKPIRCLKNIN